MIGMRNVSLLLCLVAAVPLEATTWYVRPKAGEYGAEDGTSYETAWDGLSAIVWRQGGVTAGDTLYVCGTFNMQDDGTNLQIRASGTSGNPITIRGDYPGDPGVVIGGYRVTTPWTDAGNGTWSTQRSSASIAAFEGTPGGTEYLLRATSSLAAVQSTDGSYWHDTETSTFWVNPTGTPESPRDVYTTWHNAIYGNGQDYIVLQNLTAFCGGSVLGIIHLDKNALTLSSLTSPDGSSLIHLPAGGFTEAMVGADVHIAGGTNFTPGWYTIVSWVSTNEVILDRVAASEPAVLSDGYGTVGNRAHDWTVDNCTLKYAYSEAIENGLPGYNYTFTNNTITEFTVGIYITRLYGSPEYVTISNNYFDCGDAGYYAYWMSGREWRSQDRGAILMQPGNYYTISENHIGKAVECGIFAYQATTAANTMNSLHVLRNRIDQVFDPDGLGSSFGIGIGAGNDEDSGDRTKDLVVAYNMVKSCKCPGSQSASYGVGIRLATGHFTDPDDRTRVIGNLVIDCDTNYRLDHRASPTEQMTLEYIFQNNISCAPVWGGYHCNVLSGAMSYNLDMSHNCWYPDTSGGDYRFKWANATVAVNHADFVSDASGSGIAIGTGDVVSDPLFVDASNSVYTLQDGSPCIESGVDAGQLFADGLSPSSLWPDMVVSRKQSDYGTAWEMGPYVYEETGFHELTTAAVYGSVAKSPEKTSYASNESVSLTAVPDTGYRFVSWSGDLTGSDNPATLLMDGDKTVTANFAANGYTLSTTASGGAVSRSPDQASYEYGTEVTLEAVASAGHTFSGWSGDASGTSSSVTITIDSDKSVTANFSANTYTLSVAGANGSVVADPQKTSYSYGETVSLQAVASTGYHFTAWSGDLSGSANPASIVINGNRSVTAGFAINTYTLNASALNGSVTASPDQTTYNYGTTVSLQAVAADGYEFTGWSGALSGSANPATLVMDANKSVTASFAAVSPDQEAPVLYGASPAAGAIQAPLNSLVLLHLSDADEGVDPGTVAIAVNGEPVYVGDVASYTSSSGVCRRVGTQADYTYAYQAAEDFDYDAPVTVTVNATDLEGNVMAQQSYSFRTQMRAFGSNRCASWGPEHLDKGAPATVCGADGNIWVVYHAGDEGSRDIYVSERAAGNEQFGDPIQVTANLLDQHNADIAVGTNGVLYVVWQDNRRANWDIYASTSADGVTWSAAVRVTDSNDDEINPAVVVDSQSPNRAYVTWEDNRAGNQDIYVASSSDRFVSKTVQAVTTNAQDQTDPRIAVDASNTVYVVWTDARNGTQDVYGAASNSGPWSNMPVATGTGNQFLPAIAAEPSGSVLHFAWVSDLTGDNDVYCGSSDGLPATPLTGMNIIDDTSGMDQQTPAITVTGAGDPRVFVCWQDARNAVNASDMDIYVVEIRAGDETNLLVGDGSTSKNQSEPVIRVDLDGRPYIIWTDDRNATDEIYFAASTFVEPTPLDEQLIGAAGGTVGASLPAAEDDVSVVVPAGACSYDVTVSVSKIQDLQPGSTAGVLPYEFSPSGVQFDVPVTITIPYSLADYSDNPPEPYWYDSLTGTLTQQGITNIEYVALSTTVGAMRFQTTHFTPYTLVASDSDGDDEGTSVSPSGSSSSGSGGCSLSPVTGRRGIIAFFIPYALLAAVMIMVRLRDTRRHSTPYK